MTAQRLRVLLKAAFWCCIAGVTYLALSAPPKDAVAGWDKANHLLAFGVLAWLGLRSWSDRQLQLLLGLVLYGCLIEVLQSFTGDRQADWRDIVANLLGLLLGWTAARGSRRWV